MLNIIERGIQMGIAKKVKKGQKYFWYEYAVQKKIYIMFMNMKFQKKIWLWKSVNMKIYINIYP